MKLETVWTVTDPGPTSEMADICWEATAQKLAHAVIGDHLSKSRSFGNLVFYTTQAEALADAKERIRSRDAKAAGFLAEQVSYGLTKRGHSPKCSGETVAPGHVHVTVLEQLDADRIDSVALWLAPIEAPALTVDIACGGYSVRVHGGKWSPLSNGVAS